MKRSLTPLLRPYVCQSCRHKVARSRRRGVSSSSLPKPELYDIVTVGGGPVGLSLLAALKSSPTTSHLKIALLDTQDLGQSRQWKLPPEQYSNRASSLTPSSVAFLEESGVWDRVDRSRTQPYDEMKVWDAGNDSSLQFDHRDEAVRYNAPQRAVATMTENSNLTKGLLDRISELENDSESSLLPNTEVESIQNGTDDPDGINLSTWPTLTITESSISTPRTIASRLLIGADGFNSPVRSFAGIASNGWDYNRQGVVATLKLEPREEPMDSFSSEPSTIATAYQRFIPALGGPIALLPLPENHASLVWSTTPQNAAYLKTLNPTSLAAMLNAAFRLSEIDLQYMLTLPPPSSSHTFTHADELTWRLRHTPLHPHTPPLIHSIQENTLASFPLRLRHASTYISPRVALLGDAAHTVHPLAGQGLNLGLADARALAQTIAYAVQHGQDLGDILTLERYNAERWGANAKVAGACDVLSKVYGAQGVLAGQVRGWGMGLLDAGWVPGLKGWFMRQAEG